MFKKNNLLYSYVKSKRIKNVLPNQAKNTDIFQKRQLGSDQREISRLILNSGLFSTWGMKYFFVEANSF